MELNKTTLKILYQLSKGNSTIKGIALAIKKSEKQIYVTIKSNNLLILNNKKIQTSNNHHITLLLQLLSKHPNLYILAESGIPILSSCLTPSTVENIKKETKLKNAIIYRKLQEARKQSIIIKQKSLYSINTKIWLDINEFIEATKQYESSSDERIPRSSIIYNKNNNLIFSNKQDLDATKTAFSVYKKYGIKLHLTTNYYCLPKKSLTKTEILKHSLFIIEKEKSVRLIIFVALFYLKFRKSFKLHHKILKDLIKVFQGIEVDGYPSYNEIKDRASLYNIKLINI